MSSAEQPPLSERQRIQIRLARAFLRESCRMLLEPCRAWRGVTVHSRESYLHRAAVHYDQILKTAPPR